MIKSEFIECKYCKGFGDICFECHKPDVDCVCKDKDNIELVTCPECDGMGEFEIEKDMSSM